MDVAGLDDSRAWRAFGGIDAQPQEYERRVIGFFDQTLLGKN